MNITRQQKLLTTYALGLFAAMGVVVASLSVGPAASATTTTTTKTAVVAPPFQGEKPLGLVLSVDTVVSGKAAATLTEPLPGCTETSLFHEGQTIVFRMWGVDVKAGGVPRKERQPPDGRVGRNTQRAGQWRHVSGSLPTCVG